MTAVLILFPGIAAQRAEGDDAPSGVLTAVPTSGRDEAMTLSAADQAPVFLVQPSGLALDPPGVSVVATGCVPSAPEGSWPPERTGERLPVRAATGGMRWEG